MARRLQTIEGMMPTPANLEYEASVEYVARLLDDGRWTVIDVRDPGERHEVPSHFSDTQHVPIAELELFATGWEPDIRLIVICESGRRSAHAARHLRSLGFFRTLSVRGGLRAWREAGFPLTAAAA